MRGEKELCAQIPISSLIDLRYACRLLQGTLLSQEAQLWDVDPAVDRAYEALKRIVDGYENTYKLIDSFQ